MAELYDRDTILARMLESLPSNYDISVGSVFRDFFTAIAIEFEDEYEAAETAFEKCLIAKATGDDLETLLSDFGFYRKSAVKASGTVTFTGKAEAVVPAGTTVSSGLKTYTTTEKCTIGADGTGSASIECSAAGTGGNTEAGTVTIIPVSVQNIYSVTNAEAITGGANAETDEELRARFREYYENPATSGNAADYEAWAKEVAGVEYAECVPVWNGGGTIKVVIAGDENQAVSKSTVGNVYDYISELMPIGAELTIESVAEYDVGVRITGLAIISGYVRADVISNIKTAIKTYFKTLSPSSGIISYNTLIKYIMSADGVDDCGKIEIIIDGTSYTENQALPDNSVAMLGNLEVV